MSPSPSVTQPFRYGRALGYHQILTYWQEAGIQSTVPVLLIANTAAIGPISGGIATLIGALLKTCSLLVVPSFTTQTSIIPFVGPSDNGLDYGDYFEQNRDAQFWQPDCPPDPDLGELPSALLSLQQTQRSSHPMLSYAAIGSKARQVSAVQSYADPHAPLRWLLAANAQLVIIGGWKLDNIVLRYAEQQAGKEGYLRWALTTEKIVALPHIPPLATISHALTGHLTSIGRTVPFGQTKMQSYTLTQFFQTARAEYRSRLEKG